MRAFKLRLDHLGITGAALLAHHGVEVQRGGPDHAMIRCPTPDHEDRHPSCRVHLRLGRWNCFSCSAWGDLVALHRLLAGLATMGDALTDLKRLDGRGEPPPTPRLSPASSSGRGRRSHRRTGTPIEVARWRYYEDDGRPAFDVVRRQFRQQDGSWETDPATPKPRKEVLPSAPGTCRWGYPDPYRSGRPRPLYRLVDILRAPVSAVITVCEGEKAAEALFQAGYLATTSSGGSSAPHASDWSPLGGRDVLIWPDLDEPGLAYADRARALLLALPDPPRIRLVDVDALDLPPGGDAADWISRRSDGHARGE